MNKKTLLTLTSALLGAATLAWSAAPRHEGPNLDRLKALEGTWVALDENGEMTDEVIATYKVTAGGSAVLETEFPGTDHEMITVYSIDKGQLELRHWCVVGNQPRMIASKDSGPDELIFTCDGKGGNLDCAHDKHMHQGHFRFPSKDRISSTWDMIEEGEVVYTAAFEMARKPQD